MKTINPFDIEVFLKRARTLKNRFKEGKTNTSLVLQALQWLLDSRQFNTNFLVPSPMQQLQMAKMLNHLHGWGFDDSSFEWAVKTSGNTRNMNDSTLESPTDICVLDIQLGSFEETFYTALRIIDTLNIKRNRLPGAHKYGVGLHNIGISDNRYKMPTEVVPEHKYYPHRTLRWRKIHLMKTRDQRSVQDVRDKGKPMPTTAILWAMIYNPQFVQILRTHFQIHSIWVAGCIIDPDYKDELCNVLHVNSEEDNTVIRFHTSNCRNSASFRCIPEYFEEKIWL